MTRLGTVREVWRYPVSSLGGERLEEIEASATGIAGDRVWGLVEAESGHVADPGRERRWRPVPNVKARLGAVSPQVRIGEEAWLDLPSTKADAVASRFMGFPTTFLPHVPFGETAAGAVAPRYKLAPVHLLTTASLAELGRLIGSQEQADARRFRPNVVIETEPEFSGFVEKSWIGKRLGLGEIELVVREPCARCSFTALAQDELRFEPQVLHKIAAHGGGGFGVYCAVARSGRIRAGDELRLV